jgi:hypothetical protein
MTGDPKKSVATKPDVIKPFIALLLFQFSLPDGRELLE